MRGRRPCLSRKPPFIETPMSVPSVSKRSTKKNANITTKKFIEKASAVPAVTVPSFAVCVQADGSKIAPKVVPKSFTDWPRSEK